jgi:hypothetical protein
MIMPGWGTVIGGVVGGVAGYVQGSAAESAAGEQRQQFEAAQAQSMGAQEAQQGALSPYLTAGQQAQGYLTGALGLDPSLEPPSVFEEVATAYPGVSPDGFLASMVNRGILPQGTTKEDVSAMPPERQMELISQWGSKFDAPQNRAKVQAALQAYQEKAGAYKQSQAGYEIGAQAPRAPEFQPYREFEYEGAVPEAPQLEGFQYAGDVPEFGFEGEVSQFEGIDPQDIVNDPAYQFRLEQGRAAREGSAGAGGTLLSGKQQLELERYGQGLASTEFGNAYQRALQAQAARREAEDTEYSRARGEYDIGAGREAIQYGRAAGEFGLERERQLTQAELDRSREAEGYRRATTEYGVGEAKSRADQGTAYARYADNFNRIANLAGTGTTPATQVGSDVSRITTAAAPYAGGEARVSAAAAGAAAQSLQNIGRDIYTKNWWEKGRAGDTQTFAKPIQTSAVGIEEAKRNFTI